MKSIAGSPSIEALEQLIDSTLAERENDIDAISSVEKPPSEQPFWYIRLSGEKKRHFSIEMTLGQRRLLALSYFMAEPEENRESTFDYLLRRNLTMSHMHFVIGKESAVYLKAQLENRMVDGEAIDHVLAATYEHTEQYFLEAMRLGFGSRFS